MIINDVFSAERDTYGWTLTQKRKYIDKDGAEKDSTSQCYFANFGNLCSNVIDKSLGNCADLKEVAKALKDIKKFIAEQRVKTALELKEELEEDE